MSAIAVAQGSQLELPHSTSSCDGPKSEIGGIGEIHHRGAKQRRIRSTWLMPLGFSAAMILSGVIFSFGAWGWPGQGPGWWFMPADLWATWRDSQLISSGHIGLLYSSGTGLLALPGLPILLSPFAYIAHHIGLKGGWPVQSRHPSAWPLLDPLALAMGASVLWPLNSLALRLGVERRRQIWLNICGSAVAWAVVAPMGHPEDLLSLGFALRSLLAASEGRSSRAAWLSGIALLLQQVSVLAFPMVAAIVWMNARRPLREVAKFLLRAAIIPATVTAAVFAAGPASAWKHLAEGHTNTPWTTPLIALAPGGQAGPLRALAVIGAVAIGIIVVRRRLQLIDLPQWLGLAFATRLLEPFQCPYYLAPAVLLFTLSSTLRGSWKAAIGGGLIAISLAPLTGQWQEHSPWRLWGTLLILLGTTIAISFRPKSRSLEQRTGFSVPTGVRSKAHPVAQAKIAMPFSGRAVELAKPSTPT